MILKNFNINKSKYPQASHGWKLSAESRTITPTELPHWLEEARSHPEMAFIDANQLASEPYLRTIKPGERFQPYGAGGKSQKLSDFLINNKIPREYRSDLAVAADDAGIIWIPGMRVSERCALTAHTRRLLILTLTQDT